MKQHINNASWGGVAAAFRAGYGLLNVVLIVRLLGPETYGKVAAPLSMFIFYCSLSTSLFTILVVRLMSSSGDARAHNTLLSSGVAWVVCSLVVLGIVALGVWEARLDTASLLVLMCVLSSVQIIGAFQLALIESAGRFDVAMRSQLLGPFIVLLILLAAFLWKIPLSAFSYVAVLCIGAVADLVLAWLARRTFLRLDIEGICRKHVWNSLLTLLKSGTLLQATSLMNMFLEPFNKTLLSSFLGGTAVTVYDLGMKLIWGIQSLFSSAMRVFLHIASQNKHQLESSYLRANQLVAVPAVLLHVLGCLLLVTLANFWLPLDSRELIAFFAVATLSNLGMIVVAPLYNSLIGNEDMRFIFKTQATLAMTNVAASLLLIPVLGVFGAAFGLLLATLYNATAIMKKGQHLTGNVHLTKSVFRSLGARMPWACVLFVGAVYCGFSRDIALPLGLLLLLVVLVVLAREPASVYLFAALKQKSFPAERG